MGVDHLVGLEFVLSASSRRNGCCSGLDFVLSLVSGRFLLSGSRGSSYPIREVPPLVSEWEIYLFSFFIPCAPAWPL